MSKVKGKWVLSKVYTEGERLLLSIVFLREDKSEAFKQFVSALGQEDEEYYDDYAEAFTKLDNMMMLRKQTLQFEKDIKINVKDSEVDGQWVLITDYYEGRELSFEIMFVEKDSLENFKEQNQNEVNFFWETNFEYYDDYAEVSEKLKLMKVLYDDIMEEDWQRQR